MADVVDQDRLPPLLQRPSGKQPVAKLALHHPKATSERPNVDPSPRWRLEGAPVVLSLAKRVFQHAGIAEGKGMISFPALPANFEDLLMLQHRFPISITPTAAETWNEHYAEAIDSYLLHNAAPEDVVSLKMPHFRGELKPFQAEGVQFMMAARRGLLADDMGLGKTPQSLALLAQLDTWPVAIIVQSHVIGHWKRKIAEFLRAREFNKPGGEPLTWMHLSGTKASDQLPKAHIYLLHYLVAHGWDRWLKKRGVRTVVFDEVQELRHPGSKKHDACTLVSRGADRVVGLSGTPIYNRGPEMYHVMNAINRGCLGTFTAFKMQWCDHDSDGKLIVKDPDQLGQYLLDRKLMLRRTKDEVLSELPEKRRVIEPISADNGLFAELAMEAGRLAREAATIRDPFDRARMEAAAIAQTRMATGQAKAPAVAAFLRGLLQAEQPTLIFAHHHAVYDELLHELADFNPVAITGRESMAVKERSLQAFAAGETNACLISLRAATGLDGLQERARVIVFAELDWSPAVHRQGEDRAHRYGQRESVLAYYLVTDVGTDPGMIATIGVKESQFTGMMQDRPVSEDDVRQSEQAAERHKASVLRMLRESF